MSQPAKSVPLSISSKDRGELSTQLLKIQAQAGAKVKVIAIYFDTEKGEHVLWYFPYKNFGGGVI